ncbi:MAG: hypothetical protein Greene101415_1076 [Parcubacteria group bacterium Greene1014_15]|nr:MAG: hypothetical protein Greene101415_1076 [Parcubacteria group bacterium Greene1014_15]
MLVIVVRQLAEKPEAIQDFVILFWIASGFALAI